MSPDFGRQSTLAALGKEGAVRGKERGGKENAAVEGKAAVLQREGVAGEGREAAAEGK